MVVKPWSVKPLWACFSPSTSHAWKLALWKWFLEHWMLLLLVRVLHAVASVPARDELVVCSKHNCPHASVVHGVVQLGQTPFVSRFIALSHLQHVACTQRSLAYMSNMI